MDVKHKLSSAHQPMVFRQWSGKSYAVFSSLGNAIKISTLSVACLGSFVNVKADNVEFEADTTQQKVELEEVEVNADKNPLIYSEASRMVTVISRDEIERAPVQSVNELLDYSLGVDIRQRGPGGPQADVSIRGGSFDQVLILLNGINLTDPQTGHHNLNLPVDIQSIERIEILRGPGSRIYGPDAFSGAINIITKKGERNTISALAEAGDFGYQNYFGGIGLNAGKTAHYFSFADAHSDGYINNTDFDTRNLYYNFNAELAGQDVSLQLGYNKKDFGSNSFYTPAYPDQFEATKTKFGSLQLSGGNDVQYNTSFYWRRHHDRFELFRYEDLYPAWYAGHNYHMSDVSGMNAGVWSSNENEKIYLGFDIRNEKIQSNVLGEPAQDTTSVPGEPDGQFTRKYSRDILNLYADYKLYLNNFTGGLGVSMHWNSENPDDVLFFPGIDMAYNLPKEWRLYYSFNTSYRLPTFTDKFYVGPTNIGNPDIRPEKAFSHELGVQYNDGFLDSKADLFYRQGKDIIDWIKESSEDKWVSRNLTELNTYGAEVILEVNLDQKWREQPLKTLKVNYSYTEQDKSSDELISNYALDYLKHKINFSADLTVLQRLGITVNALYQNRAGSFTFYEDGAFGEEKEYSPFWTIDLNVQYNIRYFTFFVRGTNLLDNQYYDIGNVIQPGRWVRGGVKVDLNY